MTTVQITLPDALARQAAECGLFEPEKFALILRERLHAEAVERLKVIRAAQAANPLPAMTADEVQAEIEASRAEHRLAAHP